MEAKIHKAISPEELLVEMQAKRAKKLLLEVLEHAKLMRLDVGEEAGNGTIHSAQFIGEILAPGADGSFHRAMATIELELMYVGKVKP